jgi:hypothetical protein
MCFPPSSFRVLLSALSVAEEDFFEVVHPFCVPRRPPPRVYYSSSLLEIVNDIPFLDFNRVVVSCGIITKDQLPGRVQ